MTDIAGRYASRIADNAVALNDGEVADLIAEAAEDAGVEVPYSDQGDVHEKIGLRIKQAARDAAEHEIRAMIERAEGVNDE